MKFIVKRKWLFWWTLEQAEFVVKPFSEKNKIGSKGGAWQSFKLKNGMEFEIKEIEQVPSSNDIKKAEAEGEMVKTRARLRAGHG